MVQAPPNPLREAQQTGILGSPEFVRECQRWLAPKTIPDRTLDEVFAVVSDAFGTTTDGLATRGRHHHSARDAAALMAREWLCEPLETLAARLGGVSRSSISEIVKRARQREQTDATFHAQLEAIRARLR
jgi:chromosomal replication initiation ATPase DnaA